MRDINRLDPFYNEIKHLHKQHPDLRFGQIYWLVFKTCECKGKDPFYVEDEEIIKIIRGYFK